MSEDPPLMVRGSVQRRWANATDPSTLCVLSWNMLTFISKLVDDLKIGAHSNQVLSNERTFHSFIIGWKQTNK